MNEKAIKALLFMIGAGVGSISTYLVLNTKYKIENDKKIESIKDYYYRKYEDNDSVMVPDEVIMDEKDLPEDLILNGASKPAKSEKINYAEIYDTPKNKNKGKTKSVTVEAITQPEAEKEELYPYVIPPQEFGENRDDNYAEESMVYYTDGVLTFSNGDIVEDIVGTIGYESLTKFGEYEDDAVYVRNDKYKVDYEILLDLDAYSAKVAKGHGKV